MSFDKPPGKESCSSSGDERSPLKVYNRRWIVLAVTFSAILLRGYNQSCYGPINDVYSNYFHAEPWQVDWLMIAQSVVFLGASLPLMMITIRISYRLSVLLITTTLTLSFVLTTVGVSWRGGFPVMLAGQAIMGFSNLFSRSIPPVTAAIWFPSNEVATAVAIQVVGRGVGEAVGSILPTLFANQHTPILETKTSLMYMFVALSSVAALLTFVSVFVVKNGPPTPPSEAQSKISREKQIVDRSEEAKPNLLKEFIAVAKSLRKNKEFVAVCFLFGGVSPILRNNNILLTSMLHLKFNQNLKINFYSGIALLVAWCMFTIGAFIAGPIITKTKLYKEIGIFSMVFSCLTCVLVVIGVYIENIKLIYSAVMCQGLFVGMAYTSLFELLAEVTYPHPPMFVTMATVVVLGAFRLIYPLVGRLILNLLGPTWMMAFPAIATAICSVIIIVIKPAYKREEANNGDETEILLSSS